MPKSLDYFKSLKMLILINLSSKNFDNQFTALHDIMLLFLKAKGQVENKLLNPTRDLQI